MENEVNIEEKYYEISQNKLQLIIGRQNSLFFNFPEIVTYIYADDTIDLSEVNINNWQENASVVESHKHSILSIEARLEELFNLTDKEIVKVEVQLFQELKPQLTGRQTKEDKSHLSIYYLEEMHDRRHYYGDLIRMAKKKHQQYDDKHWGLQALSKIWEIRSKINSQ